MIFFFFHTEPQMNDRLFDALCRCQSLRELYWCSIPLNLDTITRLARVLEVNPRITYLSLYGAKIGDECCRVLAGALKVFEKKGNEKHILESFFQIYDVVFSDFLFYFSIFFFFFECENTKIFSNIFFFFTFWLFSFYDSFFFHPWKSNECQHQWIK